MIQVEHLTKRYGRFTALEDCCLSVPEGEILGLLGPNGAGKTTLLRLLLGYLRPTSGTATIGGWCCSSHSVQVRRQTTYLPGEVRLFGQMRGREILRFFAEVRPEGNLQRSLKLAERLELALTARVASMSTGMRQKLALVATLAAETPLVILDEPTSNLDPTVRRVVAEIVDEIRQQGRTVLFSSHVLSEVEEVCDRVAFLRAGRLAHVQVMEELKRRHRIQAALSGPLPPPPGELKGELRIRRERPGVFVIETPGELKPLLQWLGTLPLEEINVQSVGLRSLYDRIHDAEPVSAVPPQG